MGRRRIKPTPGPLASAWLGFVYNVRKEFSLRAHQLAFAQLLCVRRHPRSHSIAGAAVRLGAGAHLQVLLTAPRSPAGVRALVNRVNWPTRKPIGRSLL